MTYCSSSHKWQKYEVILLALETIYCGYLADGYKTKHYLEMKSLYKNPICYEA